MPSAPRSVLFQDLHQMWNVLSEIMVFSDLTHNSSIITFHEFTAQEALFNYLDDVMRYSLELSTIHNAEHAANDSEKMDEYSKAVYFCDFIDTSLEPLYRDIVNLRDEWAKRDSLMGVQVSIWSCASYFILFDRN